MTPFLGISPAGVLPYFLSQGDPAPYIPETTSSVSAAAFSELCRAAGVPVQRYTNRADKPGGSTLGNISLSHVSLDSVDIGLAQLAMHSCYETAGAKDTAYLVRAMEAFFSRSFRKTPDGIRI